MPHVIVKLWPGKTEEQKQRLADAITNSIVQELSYGDESVSVAFQEIPPENWKAVYRDEIRPQFETLYKKPGYTM